MNIYKIFQTVNDDYDTFDAAIVLANNEEEAKRMHPGLHWGGFYEWNEEKNCWLTDNYRKEIVPHHNHDWAPIEKIQVELIGTSPEDKPRVILASFMAG